MTKKKRKTRKSQRKRQPLYRWTGKDGHSWKYNVIKRDHKQKEFTVETEMGHLFTVKPGDHGLTCYYSKENKDILPVNGLVGVYPGIATNEKTMDRKLGAMQPHQRKKAMSYMCQSLIWSEDGTNRYLDPCNQHGSLALQFRENPVLYCNEPGPEQKQNICGVWNYDTGRMELWAMKDLSPGEELLVSYGPSYFRNYNVAEEVRGCNCTKIFKDGEISLVE